MNDETIKTNDTNTPRSCLSPRYGNKLLNDHGGWNFNAKAKVKVQSRIAIKVREYEGKLPKLFLQHSTHYLQEGNEKGLLLKNGNE